MLRNRKGFTLIELLVVIAIIAILAAILFPVFARARAKAQASNCLSNVKQIEMSMQMYLQDHNGLHTGYTWCWGPWLHPYVKNNQIFRCPTDTGAGWDNCAAVVSLPMSYAIQVHYRPGNIGGFTYSVWALDYPAERMNISDGTNLSYSATETVYFARRHNDGGNVSFCDGHVKWMSGQQMDHLGAVLAANDNTHPDWNRARRFWWGLD